MATFTLLRNISVIVVMLTALSDLWQLVGGAPVEHLQNTTKLTNLWQLVGGAPVEHLHDTAKPTRACLKNCEGQANGDYPSCLSCHNYVTCSNQIFYQRPCPASLVWDDIMTRCEWVSSTCEWSSILGEIQTILDENYTDYINLPATDVAQTTTTSFFAQVLTTFFDNSEDCQDTFLIDYTTSNFYNHLITFADGNVAVTIENTVENNDIDTPDDFEAVLDQLDEALQEPVYDLLDFLEDLELDPAWEMTLELRGFIHSSENSGLMYKDAMVEATNIITKWFQENVDKCPADESTYGVIASAMEAGTEAMTQTVTQEVIDEIMEDTFAQMNATDVQLINAALVKAKMMRNLIWTKLKTAMAAGRETIQASASISIGAVLHAQEN